MKGVFVIAFLFVVLDSNSIFVSGICHHSGCSESDSTKPKKEVTVIFKDQRSRGSAYSGLGGCLFARGIRGFSGFGGVPAAPCFPAGIPSPVVAIPSQGQATAYHSSFIAAPQFYSAQQPAFANYNFQPAVQSHSPPPPPVQLLPQAPVQCPSSVYPGPPPQFYPYANPGVQIPVEVHPPTIAIPPPVISAPPVSIDVCGFPYAGSRARNHHGSCRRGCRCDRCKKCIRVRL